MIAFLNKLRSAIPTANPIPMIGPISGEMSMAPIMTAVELTLSPKEAMKTARISIHRVAPWKSTPSVICAITLSSEALSGITLKYLLTTCHSVWLLFGSMRFGFCAKIMFICDIMVLWITIFLGVAMGLMEIRRTMNNRKNVGNRKVIKQKKELYQAVKPLQKWVTALKEYSYCVVKPYFTTTFCVPLAVRTR